MTTPPPAQSAQVIRRVVTALRAGRVPAPEDAALVADGIEWLLETATRGGTFARAFELDTGYAAELLPKRDRLLIEIAGAFFPDLSPWTAAGEIVTEFKRYRSAALQHDLARGQCAEPPGSLRAALFDLARLDQDVPGQRRVRDILIEAGSQTLDLVESPLKPVRASFNRGVPK